MIKNMHRNKKINGKMILIVIYTLMMITVSCKKPTNSKSIENESGYAIQETQTETNQKTSNNADSTFTDKDQLDLKVDEFVNRLKSGKNLSSLFCNNWTLIYHEDNRFDGSTDGQIDKLLSTQIDTLIRIQVRNDGVGWLDKKDPKSFELDFSIKKLIKDWDRFEIPDYENQEKKVFYVKGRGESDYIKVHYDANNLIVKLEYRSEDPG